MDDGEQSIDDAAIDAQIRKQARRVYAQSILTALVLTAIALAIPGRG